MKKNILLWMLVLGFSLIYLTSASPAKAKTTPPLIGVIRFDIWDSSLSPSLIAKDIVDWGPQIWNYRLPYFTTWDSSGKPIFNGKDQSNIDKDIQLAGAAGISYFAFDYCFVNDHTPPITPDYINAGYGLKKYLASTVNSNVKFSLLIIGGSCLGDKTTWTTVQAPLFTALSHNAKYQTVLGGRPLLYFYLSDNELSVLKEETKTDLSILRQQIRNATGKDPYFVTMKYPVPDDMTLGFDGRSQYVGLNDYTSRGDPYSPGVPKSNLDLWNRYYQAGYQVIPTVTTGWDMRPRPAAAADPNTIWFQQAKPAEIASNLSSAINWVKSHPDKTKANSIIIYAWNESIEGGWITPTLFEGDARLQAISNAIQGHGFDYPRVGGVDLNGDHKIDIFDYNILVAKYGNPYTLDYYNQLVANFGK